jgi:5-oxoprolinase (ATP-hydrolysing)
MTQGEGITEILMAPGKLKDSIPGISGTRNLSDNLSDLKAQVAANNRGIALVTDLIAEYGLPTVTAYMHHIQVSRSLRTPVIQSSGSGAFERGH